MKLLIVEDEIELLIAISNYLIKEKYLCELAENFTSAQEKLAVNAYDLILLDISLPDGNGLELLKTIKEYQEKAGVIIVSAKNSSDDKIGGLDLGADDYITKPFELAELNSRINAVLRRRKFEGNSILKFHEMVINTDNKLVTIHRKNIKLTKKEYDLLLFLLINKNRVLTKETIAEHLWHDSIDMADNFDFIYTHLNNLRNKIKNAGGVDYIKTVYGMGYRFTDS